MSNIARKIQDNQDKQILFEVWNKKPKHRCSSCHRFTLWRPPIDDKGNFIEHQKPVCHWCKK